MISVGLIQKKAQKGPIETALDMEGKNPRQREQILGGFCLLADPQVRLDLLADHRLPVVAGHVMEFHPVPEKRGNC